MVYASFSAAVCLPAAVDQLKIAFQITPNAAVKVTLSSTGIKLNCTNWTGNQKHQFLSYVGGILLATSENS